jgi:hypothetical protein
MKTQASEPEARLQKQARDESWSAPAQRARIRARLSTRPIRLRGTHSSAPPLRTFRRITAALKSFSAGLLISGKRYAAAFRRAGDDSSLRMGTSPTLRESLGPQCTSHRPRVSVARALRLDLSMIARRWEAADCHGRKWTSIPATMIAAKTPPTARIITSRMTGPAVWPRSGVPRDCLGHKARPR